LFIFLIADPGDISLAAASFGFALDLGGTLSFFVSALEGLCLVAFSRAGLMDTELLARVETVSEYLSSTRVVKKPLVVAGMASCASLLTY